ncbi:MAG TPA: ABC transporter ATP-binding protein, partial [Gammaproteobacteria bacterium]|nr:ABC transporter ATP-binding protein [Gammaproteobacteria bacterium]
VILDEPTVGLDPIQIREIRALIRELGQAHSVILSTHILPEVQAICSNVQIIHQGQLVFADSVANLDSQLTGTNLILGAKRLPPESELTAITGVQSVSRLDTQRIRITHQADLSPLEILAHRALDQDWGLLELTPERQTLEQVFMDLTLSDDKASDTQTREYAA